MELLISLSYIMWLCLKIVFFAALIITLVAIIKEFIRHLF